MNLIFIVLTLYMGGNYPANTLPIANVTLQASTIEEAIEKCTTARKFYLDNRAVNNVLEAECGKPMVFRTTR